MSVNVPIKHHYVPVFYLKTWAKADGRVTRYHRPLRDVVTSRVGPEYTGYEDHLYTLQGLPPGQAALIETSFFSPVDSGAAVAHQLMLDGKLNSLSNQHRTDWARFMLSTQLRNPFSIGELQGLAEQTMRQVLCDKEPGFAEDIDFTAEGSMYEWVKRNHPYVIQDAAKRFLPGMIDHENLGQYLINMIWGVVDLSAAPNTLLTCDRPFQISKGWKDPNAVLVFPLSPHLIWVGTNNVPRMRYIINLNSRHHVRVINDAVARQAVDMVIGLDNSHLTFIERRLRRRDEEPVPGPIGKGRPNCPE